jgi:hypothetical protein
MNKYVLNTSQNRKVSKVIRFLKLLEGTPRKNYNKSIPPKKRWSSILGW